ncbi:MAG: lytic transglycosylase domain-containing protein [Syntrophobacterales bacterium]|jgi:soluble lytic murein transglycosylase|nr:lytic transglycosylase domain-containing protein [Syntrophobacterales bacterium]
MSKFTSISVIITAVLLFTVVTAVRVFSDEIRKDDAYVKEKIVDYLKSKKVRTSEDKLKTIADRVYEESRECGVDYRLILAVMKVESNFRSDAVSKRGARGLLQIMPSLARHVSKDMGIQVKGSKTLNEPEKNIKIGVNHISSLLEKFENLKTALHAYNVGSYKIRNKVSKDYAPDTPFTRKVLHEYNQMLVVLPDLEEEE